MSKETNLTKKQEGALATNMFEADANAGTHNMEQDDLALPFLKVLGQLSPEINKQNGKYVQGAEPGMIYSSSFGNLIDGNKGIDVVIAHTQTRWPEWQDMGDSPSAPVGTHLEIPADSTEEKNGRYRLANGNYVEKTMYFYVVAIVGNELRKAVITMRSSNLTPGRELNNLIANLRMTDSQGTFQPAAYSAVFNLKTVGKNWGDKSWHVYKPSLVKMLDVSNSMDAEAYTMAQNLQKEVSKGSAKPKYDKVEKKSTKDII